jgi:hypothetical protein
MLRNYMHFFHKDAGTQSLLDQNRRITYLNVKSLEYVILISEKKYSYFVKNCSSCF